MDGVDISSAVRGLVVRHDVHGLPSIELDLLPTKRAGILARVPEAQLVERRWPGVRVIVLCKGLSLAGVVRNTTDGGELRRTAE